jgi:RNA polymerase sigma-70 factor (ECF subfamily)
MRASLDAGRAAHPGVILDGSRFVGRLEAIAGAEGQLPPLEHAGDLFLALACASGDARAIAIFHEAFDRVLVRAIARIDARPAFVDDVAQRVREKLLVNGASTARIAEYEGKAPLRSFLRAVAVRAAIAARRPIAEGQHEQIESHRDGLSVSQSPEIQYLKARYKGEFEASLRVAVASLSSRERSLLRLQWVDGLSIDVIGIQYRVGRSTAARWIAAAREVLFSRTRQDLVERLKLSASDIESIAALVRSQLELSAADLLRSA